LVDGHGVFGLSVVLVVNVLGVGDEDVHSVVFLFFGFVDLVVGRFEGFPLFKDGLLQVVLGVSSFGENNGSDGD